MFGGAVYVDVESLDAAVVESLDAVVIESLDAGAEVAGLTKIAIIKVTASAAAASLQVVDEFAMMIITAEFEVSCWTWRLFLSCCFNSGWIA